MKKIVVLTGSFNPITKAKERLYKSYIDNCKKSKLAPKLTELDYLNINSMKDVVNCSFLKAGHGFALKALLQGDIKVTEDGEIINNGGLLV